MRYWWYGLFTISCKFFLRFVSIDKVLYVVNDFYYLFHLILVPIALGLDHFSPLLYSKHTNIFVAIGYSFITSWKNIFSAQYSICFDIEAWQKLLCCLARTTVKNIRTLWISKWRQLARRIQATTVQNY
jgi:hypothetical protein